MKMVEMLRKLLILLIFGVMLLPLAYSSINVINVEINENYTETVIYDPLTTGSGNFFDTGENQSSYTAVGRITIQNTHPTEAVNDVVLNFTNLTHAHTFTFGSGANGIVLSETSTDAILFVPDLGSGQNSTFTYTVNTTSMAPPLNMTASYSDSRIFSGLTFNITDLVQNRMNASIYPENCIYNISIAQVTQSIVQGSDVLNFTFVNGSTIGDATNTTVITPANRTMNWNVSGLQCLNAGGTNNISYQVQTPAGVSTATTYHAVNSTITYRVNTTVSTLTLAAIDGVGDLELVFQKYLQSLVNGSDATWNITPSVTSQTTDLTVNLTSVSLFVSSRNATGTGFTNPNTTDVDTVNGTTLLQTYTPKVFLNNTQPNWNNQTEVEWLFNYTISPTPIVWMDLENHIVDDGVQLTNRSVSYGTNVIYVKEIYLATGYWLEITKNITRIAEGNYTVKIEVVNRGTSPTPADEVVVVYNFLPAQFNLTTVFNYSNSTWYNTTETNTTLTDVIYNGTMYQYAIIPNGNVHNSSLDRYNGSTNNLNNTWNVTYNITGIGEFNFEDLFLTGVDPLSVKEYGGTQALSIDNVVRILSGKVEYILMGIAALLAAAVFIF